MKEEEGVLVRLENRKDGVGAVTFDERETCHCNARTD